MVGLEVLLSLAGWLADSRLPPVSAVDFLIGRKMIGAGIWSHQCHGPSTLRAGGRSVMRGSRRLFYLRVCCLCLFWWVGRVPSYCSR